MGLSYLRSNPLDDGAGLDEETDLSGPSDLSSPVDLSALLSPELYRRPLLAPPGGGGAPSPPSPSAPPTFGEPGPQGLFPAQPKLPIAAPADEDPDAPPRNDLLSRFAARLGTFGAAATPDDQRQALRQALIQAGLTMASNAGTHGAAAIAPALLGGFTTYRGAVEQAAAGREQQAQQQAAEDDRKARLAMDQGRYKQQADLQQQAIDAKGEAVQAKRDQLQAKLETHQKMLDVIQKSDPGLAAKLAPLAGSDTNAIETAYMQSLKPEKPVSPKGQLQTVGRTLLYLDPDDPTHPKPIFTAPRDVDPVVSQMRADQQDRLQESALATDANRILHSGMDYINSHNLQVQRGKADLRAQLNAGTLDEKAYQAALAQIPAPMEVPAGAYDSALQQARAAADARLAARGRPGTIGPSSGTAAPPSPTTGTPATPSASALNPGGVAKVRALLATLSPVAARQKLLATGLAPAMVDAYLQAAGQQ